MRHLGRNEFAPVAGSTRALRVILLAGAAIATLAPAVAMAQETSSRGPWIQLCVVFVMATVLVAMLGWYYRRSSRHVEADGIVSSTPDVVLTDGEARDGTSPPQSHEHLYLKMPVEGGRTRRLALDVDALEKAGEVIGRDRRSATIPIDRPHISRRHAKLSLRDGALWLEDLNSTNGTFTADGTAVLPGRPVRLTPQDVFRIADTDLTIDDRP